jgi:hypothetical protein
MATWVLLFSVVSSNGSIALTSVTGFSSENRCIVAAKMLEIQINRQSSTHYACVTQ